MERPAPSQAEPVTEDDEIEMAFTLDDMRQVTYRNREYASIAIERAAAYTHDRDHDKRVAARECLYCFYLRGHGLAGQAFTDWKCRACGKEDTYANTATPHFCNDCSDQLHVCICCGADLDLKMRRKLEIGR